MYMYFTHFLLIQARRAANNQDCHSPCVHTLQNSLQEGHSWHEVDELRYFSISIHSSRHTQKRQPIRGAAIPVFIYTPLEGHTALYEYTNISYSIIEELFIHIDTLICVLQAQKAVIHHG